MTGDINVAVHFLRAYPRAFAGLAGALLKDYLRACDQAKQPPDEDLVQEVKRLL